MREVTNLVGKQFSRWTVIGAKKRVVGRMRKFKCRCHCGSLRTIRIDALKSGTSKSCGCFRAELYRKTKCTHGCSYTPEYKTWSNMIDRCEKPSNISYKRYGGKGITVGKEWRNSFVQFLKDMGQKPSPKHSIERVENNSNYCASNCIWATRKQQARNRSSNRLISHNGKIKTVAEWSERTGISSSCITSRLNRKWPVSRALS